MVKNRPNPARGGIPTGGGKKKLRSELTRYFPKRFSETSDRNLLAQRQAYLIAQLKHALDPTPESDKILHTAFVSVVGQSTPSSFRDDEKNVIVAMEKNYVKVGVTLAEWGCQDYENLSVFQYYNWLETLDDKIEAQKEALKPKPNAAKR